jgi:hypothetical protein
VDNYVTVREKLGWVTGRKVIDITQQDEEEYLETGEAYVVLMFDDGSTLKFPVEKRAITIERIGCRS